MTVTTIAPAAAAAVTDVMAGRGATTFAFASGEALSLKPDEIMADYNADIDTSFGVDPKVALTNTVEAPASRLN